MSERAPRIVEMPPHYDDVVPFLQLFFPQFFDSDSPQYVDPDTLTQLIWIAEDARPYCLKDRMQNYAQTLYTAYLVSLRDDLSTGKVETPVAGPIVMEKEGDISVSYATSSTNTEMKNSRPSSDPWSLWNKLWSQCGRGAITTRYGDPTRMSGLALTNIVQPLALNVWRAI